jgi:2'-5' RNA ligase/GNAT superfamily N-acetyltransferase
VPPPVGTEVDGLRRACGDGALGRVPPHCTLVPPVNVREEHIDAALAHLRAEAARTRPFTVELGPAHSFLPDSPVLFLAVGGVGAGALVQLRERVFREPLSRPVTWPFVPHVTLAEEMHAGRIDASVHALADYRAEVTFDRVHLLEEGEGRMWTPIADVEFRAPAVVGRGGLELELAVSDALDAEGRAFGGREWGPWDERPLAITGRRDGRVVGTAEGWTHGDVGYLARLLVAAEVRGEGVGTQLMAAFESEATVRGCTRLVVRTFAGSRAETFYRGRGWREEARWPWVNGRVFVQLVRE